MQQGLPLVISYDGPNDDEEISGPVLISDPLLQPVDWEMIGTLGGEATIIESPWGQYYKLEYQTDSPLDKSYRVSQAVKSLEDTAEELRNASRNRATVESQVPYGGGLFGSLGAGTSGGSPFGSAQTHSNSLTNTGGLGAFGSPATNTGGGPFSRPSTGGFGTGLFGQQNQSQPTSSSLFGGIGGPTQGSKPSFSFGTKVIDTPRSGTASIEKYALTETSYPSTALSGMILQDWFLNGSDNLENAFIATDQPDILKILLFTISQPGFQTVLRLKLFNDNRIYMERISCASAYAIKVLHRQGSEAFAYVLLHSPSSVLLDTILFSRGALIPEGMEYQVLQAAAVTLTTSEPKDTKEVTYARAVAFMIARIVDRFYKEDIDFVKGEGERAERLKGRMSVLIKQVFEAPATISMPNNRRSVITAAAALSGLILAGVLTFADDLQKRREKNIARAELAVTAVLSCIGFAVPVPYFAAASGLATVLGSAIVKHIWRPKDPELKSTLVIQTLQTVLWPLVRRREVLPVGLVGLTFEEASEFKMFFELVLQSAWMRYWHCN